jgi:hypothetical protein
MTLLVVASVAVAVLVLVVLLRRTYLGSILFLCMPELIACLRDEESRRGLQEMMACSDPEAPRIQKQAEELKHLEVPGDVNIAIARVLDQYPTQQLATFSRMVVEKTAHVPMKKVINPKKCIEFRGEPLPMNLADHQGKWWRTHTDSWDNWHGSYMNFAEAEQGNWELHINYQVETAMRGTIRRTVVESIPAEGIREQQFGTRLIMWDTETTEVWKLLHQTEDARLFVICASTQIPQPRIDSIVLIVSRTPHLSLESEAAMKQALKERGLQWDHFFVLDNHKYRPDAPVIPFQNYSL